MEPIGPQIRYKRRRLGLTLDELAAQTSISKPYLSLIETGRVANPPSDEKLRRLEQTLGFVTGQLVGQARLMRTPRDVRLMLTRLLRKEGVGSLSAATMLVGAGVEPTADEGLCVSPAAENGPRPRKAKFKNGLDLDTASLDGVLQELVDKTSANVGSVKLNAIPIINRVSAGYPKDFTDLNYPRGVADDWIGCPNLFDPDAFACRVHGDSMTPKYRQGDIVVFSPAAAPRSGDDCFVRFEDGQTTFKRAFFEMNGQGKSMIRLEPRNEKHRPQVIPAENVAGLFKAKFKYQSVDEL